MSTDSNDTSRPPGFRLGMADVLMVVMVLLILPHARGSMLDDPGLGWHLRNVDAMLQQGGWLENDPFSGPRHGQPWLANQWLGDLWLNLGWQWGGLEGIAVAATLVLALTFRWLYQMLIADGVAPPLAATWTLLGAAGTSLSWVARPNLFTLLMLMVTAWLLDRFHRGAATKCQMLWLLPLFVVWANAHGGFVAGLVTMGVAIGVEAGAAFFLPSRDDRQAASGRLKFLCGLLTGCLATTLLNPYGWRLYPWIFQLLGDKFFMNLHTEWLSPNFRAPGALRFEILILALPFLLALRRGRVSFVALAMSIVWLHFALGGVRYMALWVVVSIPLLARSSQATLGNLNWPMFRPDAAPWRHGRGGWVATSLLVFSLLTWSRLADDYASHAPKNIPSDALMYLVRNHEGAVVFHHYNWGGWITWHGWPYIKNWIDDRNEVQGQAHIEQYFRIIAGGSEWETVFSATGVEVVCIPVDAPLASQLANHVDWFEQYRDGYAVVYRSVPRLHKEDPSVSASNSHGITHPTVKSEIDRNAGALQKCVSYVFSRRSGAPDDVQETIRSLRTDISHEKSPSDDAR